MSKVEYDYRRLCFKAEIIEPLEENDFFIVNTPQGRFKMTKAEFYNVFENVTKSNSYKKEGIYHYPTIPSKALQFLIDE